jgi:hypothetical protein
MTIAFALIAVYVVPVLFAYACKEVGDRRRAHAAS